MNGELSTNLKKRRLELDISQAQLAKLSGISESIISEIEDGKNTGLDQGDLSHLLRIIGLNTKFGLAQGLNHCLNSTAQNISTSYKYSINPSQLEDIFVTGIIPKEFHAHIITLLEETPLPTLVMALQEVSNKHADITPGKILEQMNRWANEFKIYREVW